MKQFQTENTEKMKHHQKNALKGKENNEDMKQSPQRILDEFVIMSVATNRSQPLFFIK